MEIQQIRYFLAAAKFLNFTRAAEACSVSQPAMTRAIRKLEDEVGGPLFRREGRRTHLTELGQVLRPRLEQALQLTDLALEEAGNFTSMEEASLNLGIMCTIAPESIIDLVKRVSEQAPKLTLNLHEKPAVVLTQMLL